MSLVQCEDVSLSLAESVDREAELALPLEMHLQTCLRCQAELAQYRKLMRALRGLRHHSDLTDDFMPELLEFLRPPASVHRLPVGAGRAGVGRRRAYIGGIAAAATAGAAGAIVIASRISRHHVAS